MVPWCESGVVRDADLTSARIPHKRSMDPVCARYQDASMHGGATGRRLTGSTWSLNAQCTLAPVDRLTGFVYVVHIHIHTWPANTDVLLRREAGGKPPSTTAQSLWPSIPRTPKLYLLAAPRKVGAVRQAGGAIGPPGFTATRSSSAGCAGCTGCTGCTGCIACCRVACGSSCTILVPEPRRASEPCPLASRLPATGQAAASPASAASSPTAPFPTNTARPPIASTWSARRLALPNPPTSERFLEAYRIRPGPLLTAVSQFEKSARPPQSASQAASCTAPGFQKTAPFTLILPRQPQPALRGFCVIPRSRCAPAPAPCGTLSGV